jgi:hypothetical protein
LLLSRCYCALIEPVTEPRGVEKDRNNKEIGTMNAECEAEIELE